MERWLSPVADLVDNYLLRIAEKNNRAWCGRCMDPFERCWNVCAKPARGRVHPVAVVTASSRMSRNSRAGWPPVLQPTGAPCERVVQCSFIPMIGREEQQHASHTVSDLCCMLTRGNTRLWLCSCAVHAVSSHPHTIGQVTVLHSLHAHAAHPERCRWVRGGRRGARCACPCPPRHARRASCRKRGRDGTRYSRFHPENY